MPTDTSAIVLVVEDDASMSQAIERMLRAGGYGVILFGSAEYRRFWAELVNRVTACSPRLLANA